jgi:hypothetical protein
LYKKSYEDWGHGSLARRGQKNLRTVARQVVIGFWSAARGGQFTCESHLGNRFILNTQMLGEIFILFLSIQRVPELAPYPCMADTESLKKLIFVKKNVQDSRV